MYKNIKTWNIFNISLYETTKQTTRWIKKILNFITSVLMLEAIFIFWIWTPKLYIVTHTFGQKKDPNDNDDGQTPYSTLAKM